VHNGNHTVRFGAFEADLSSGEIRRDGNRVKLQDQPFKVLQILLGRPGELITREELQSRIWPNESFGDFDHAVNVAVAKLRAALGDSAENPSYIETVPRRGYRFVGRLDGIPVDTDPRRGPPDPGPVRQRNRVLRLSLVMLLSGMLVCIGVFLGRRMAHRQPPEFQRLTVRRGTIYCARFAPDGHTVLYAASWDAAPTEIFWTDLRLPGTRSVGLPATQLLALSSSGELAVLQPADLRFGLTFRGTLGHVPLTGGSPRQLTESIDWADWAPDGANLAIVREVAGKQRLEFPVGQVLYETAGWVSHPRVSPKGDQVAFLDHPIYGDDRGDVAIVDRAGHKTVLSTGWETAVGLAWSAGGNEIWFSAARSGVERHIYAVDLEGRQRLVFGAPGSVTMQDIFSDGRVLVTRDDQRYGMLAVARGAAKEQEFSWGDWSVPSDISKDGSTLLFDEEGAEGGPNYTVAIRDLHGSSPIPLGEGFAGSFSPDGRWAATTIAGARLLLLPTAAGTPKQLERGDIQHYWNGSDWTPDGKQVIFSGARAGHAVQCFAESVEGGKPRPVTPEGTGYCQISPDGKLIAAQGLATGDALLYALSGGSPRPIPGLLPNEYFVWTSDPHFLYAYQPKPPPVRVYRLNIENGQRQLFRELTHSDLAGLRDLANVHFSSDGRAYVYSYYRMLSQLYLVEGLQ
jgi:DNA-binding winged helix-turn-helix (wHTH) protein/Tol biopolymer transport system component